MFHRISPFYNPTNIAQELKFFFILTNTCYFGFFFLWFQVGRPRDVGRPARARGRGPGNTRWAGRLGDVHADGVVPSSPPPAHGRRGILGIR